MTKPCLAYAVLLIVLLSASSAHGQQGVKGSVIRPRLVKAQVAKCEIAKPGQYNATSGDLIELEYTYPTNGTAIPTQVGFTQTLIGAIAPNPLGIREVFTPNEVGLAKIAFYFDARNAGSDDVWLIIDKNQYKYTFVVSKAK